MHKWTIVRPKVNCAGLICRTISHVNTKPTCIQRWTTGKWGFKLPLVSK